jgi:biopolymer transport protein ExbD
VALAAVRPRRYGFPLTALADAMFQLLVFFMLSSSLSPYSLIPLTPGVLPAGAAPAGAATAGPVQLWHLGRGQVRAEGRVVPLAAVAELAEGLRAAPDTGVIVVPGPAATVQDLARVTEALAVAGVARVQVVAGSRAAGG